jgi:endo-1,4-beta-xylanase
VQGSYTLDDSVYQVIKNTRTNKPSIEGTATFDQFFSIRQSRRQSGTISITEHFKKWEEMGLQLGSNMYEAKFLVEAGGGKGWFEASYLSFE